VYEWSHDPPITIRLELAPQQLGSSALASPPPRFSSQLEPAPQQLGYLALLASTQLDSLPLCAPRLAPPPLGATLLASPPFRAWRLAPPLLGADASRHSPALLDSLAHLGPLLQLDSPAQLDSLPLGAPRLAPPPLGATPLASPPFRAWRLAPPLLGADTSRPHYAPTARCYAACAAAARGYAAR
jgi:hypothetical protein